MIQRPLHYYARRFLDDAPTESLACGVYAVYEDHALIRCTDGSDAVNIDFFFGTEEEQEAALNKLDRIEEALAKFSMALREQVAKKRAVADTVVVLTAAGVGLMP
jgi:hypothetical protein